MGKARAFSNHVRWSDAETEAILQLYRAAPHPDLLAALPGRSLSQIQNKANSLGLERIKAPKRSAEETRAAKRQHMARRRTADPDAVRAYQRKFHQDNRERQKQKLRDYCARRFFWTKANKLRGEGAATHEELARLWHSQRGRCALTGDRLDRSAEPDHKIPRTRGGTDAIENLQWTTRAANRAKRDMTDEEFFALCARIVLKRSLP